MVAAHPVAERARQVKRTIFFKMSPYPFGKNNSIICHQRVEGVFDDQRPSGGGTPRRRLGRLLHLEVVGRGESQNGKVVKKPQKGNGIRDKVDRRQKVEQGTVGDELVGQSELAGADDRKECGDPLRPLRPHRLEALELVRILFDVRLLFGLGADNDEACEDPVPGDGGVDLEVGGESQIDDGGPVFSRGKSGEKDRLYFGDFGVKNAFGDKAVARIPDGRKIDQRDGSLGRLFKPSAKSHAGQTDGSAKLFRGVVCCLEKA